MQWLKWRVVAREAQPNLFWLAPFPAAIWAAQLGQKTVMSDMNAKSLKFVSSFFVDVNDGKTMKGECYGPKFVIFEAPECTKTNFWRGELGELTALPMLSSWWGGAHYPSPRTLSPTSAIQAVRASDFGPSGRAGVPRLMQITLITVHTRTTCAAK